MYPNQKRRFASQAVNSTFPLLALLLALMTFGNACSYMATREKGDERQAQERMGKKAEAVASASADTAIAEAKQAEMARLQAQEAELKSQLFDVTRTLSSYLKFENDSASVSGSAEPQLVKLAEVLSRLPSEKIKLSGFTDSRGERDHNQVLAQKRVESVRDFLISHGVGQGQIELEALGETAPVATNRTEEGRSLNRRVEIAVEGASSG